MTIFRQNWGSLKTKRNPISKNREKKRSEEYIWELKFKKAHRWDQRCGLWSRHHIATSDFSKNHFFKKFTIFWQNWEVPKNETKADIKKSRKIALRNIFGSLSSKRRIAGINGAACGPGTTLLRLISWFSWIFMIFFEKPKNAQKWVKKFSIFFDDAPRERYEESVAGLRKTIRNKLEFWPPKEGPMQI